MSVEGVMISAAVIQCLVGFLIMRQHRHEVSWGLNWFAAAMLTGALANVAIFFLSQPAPESSPLLLAGHTIVFVLGFASLTAMLLGMLQFTTQRFRGSLRWALAAGLLMTGGALGLVWAGMPLGGDFVAAMVFAAAAGLAWRAHRREGAVGFDFLSASLFVYPLTFVVSALAVESLATLRSIAALIYAVIGVALLAVVLGRRTHALNRGLQQRKVLESQWQLTNRMVEASADALMLLQGGRICSANGACAQLFGCELSDLSGRDFFEFAAVEQADGVSAKVSFGQLQAATSAHRPAFFTWLCRRADGQIFPAEGALSRLQDGPGEAYVVSLRDVTERRASERMLNESRDQYQSLVNNIPGIAYRCLHDDHWTMLFISAHVDKVTGYTAAELLGNAAVSYASLIVPEDNAMATKLVFMAIREHQPWEVEYRVRHRDGSIRWAYEKGQAVFDQAGSVRYIDGFILDVTARKQAELQLRDSEDRFRLISSNLPNSWVFQLECGGANGPRFTFASAGVEQLFGLLPDEVMCDASRLFERICPDDRKMLHQRESEALEKMADLRLEYRCRGGAGDVRWFLRSASPRRLSDGSILWDGIEIDITAEKLASLEFERQVLAFAVLNEIASGSELTLAEQLSRALCLGADFLDLEAAVICESEDGHCTVIALENRVDVGLAIGSRFPQAESYCDLPISNGGLVAIGDMANSPYRDHPAYRKLQLATYIGTRIEVRGRVYGCLSFSGRGVRDKEFSDGEHYFVHLLARWVASAIERDQAARQVRRLAYLVRHANDAMFLLRDGAFLACNDAALTIFQMPREALVGSSPEKLSPPFQSSGGASGNLAREYIAAVLAGSPQRFEWRHLKGDGSVFDADVSLSSFSEDGETLVIAVVRDVSIRKQREREIGELNDTLELRVAERTEELASALENLRHTQDELLQSEKLASLGALVAGVAHELNTPIGNAVTVSTTLVDAHSDFSGVMAEGLTRRALDEFVADIGEGAHIIERNLARAAELLGSFKQLAVDQTSYQRRIFDLEEVVREVTLAMRPTLKRAPFRLEEELPEGLQLDSFPGPLGQVLMNLINNAVMHAFEGQESGVIRVVARAEQPGFVSLTISDNGSGIPQALQKRIFDPFYTTRLGRGGSGLGLHITYRLVTGILGGRIDVSSAPGQGSSFRMVLPQNAPAQPEPAEAH